MQINKLTKACVTALFITAGFHQLSLASASDTAQAKYSQSISEDYLVSTDFNPYQLFSRNVAHTLSITLPQLGKLDLVHEGTNAIDSAGKVLRWQGHLQGHQDFTAQFVRGLSGNITGMINTPQGRILLGNANGQYFFHREAADVAPQSGINHLPAILNATDEPAAVPNPNTSASILRPDDKLIAYPVEFNIAGLANLSQGQDAQISLPGTGDFVVRNDGTLPGDLGGATFVGHLKDFGDDFRIVVSYSPSGAQGSILTPYGEFQLQTLGAQQWLVDITRSKLEQHKSDDADSIIPPPIGAGEVSIAPGDIAASTISTTTSTTSTTSATTASGKTQVDVLVLYTPGLESRLGGNSQALTRIQLLTALANQAYTDSNVQITLRVVGAVKINMTDNTSNSQELSNMQSASGNFANIRTLRQTYGADLVTLVRPFYKDGQGGNCGVGYIGGYGGSNIANYASYGYSVVSDGSDVGGTSYYCNNYTFTHELGHNMGSMHDRTTVQSQGGGTGAYPYSFGYGVSGTFGTIMSYINPVVGKFSTPNVNCSSSNLPCGVAATDTTHSADNSQSLNNTKTAVSSFMTSNDSLPVTISGIVSKSGIALANVAITPSVTGATCTNSGSNGVYSCTVTAGWTGKLTPSLSGYTFTPSFLSFSNVQASAANQNFTATATSTIKYTISGIVTRNGKPLANATITASSGNATCSKSNTSGAYACIVPKGWTGQISILANNIRFTPSLYSFSNVQGNLSGKNFTGTPFKVQISGYIRTKNSGIGNVQIIASSGSVSCSKTNSQGAYSCLAPLNWTGSLTPSANGYSFTPNKVSYTKIGSDQSNRNFEAKRR